MKVYLTFTAFLPLRFCIDPLGCPTVPAGSDHCFHTYFRPSVPTFQNIAKQTSLENNDRYWTLGLVEEIIDDTCLV